jgi:hypothetical protein
VVLFCGLWFCFVVCGFVLWFVESLWFVLWFVESWWTPLHQLDHFQLGEVKAPRRLAMVLLHYTPEQFEQLGLRRAGFSDRVQQHTKAAKNLERFASVFGASPTVCSLLFDCIRPGTSNERQQGCET